MRTVRRLSALILAAIAAVAFVAAGTTPARAETTTIAVGDFWFCDESAQGGTCETDIFAGDTIVWDFSPASSTHTSTSTDGIWDSGTVNGGTFRFTFDAPGTYPYQCDIHPTQMMGTIVVHEGERPPTPTPIVTGPPVDFISPTATAPTGGLPTSGQGPSDGGADGWWLAVLLSATGIALVGAAALAARRAR